MYFTLNDFINLTQLPYILRQIWYKIIHFVNRHQFLIFTSAWNEKLTENLWDSFNANVDNRPFKYVNLLTTYKIEEKVVVRATRKILVLFIHHNVISERELLSNNKLNDDDRRLLRERRVGRVPVKTFTQSWKQTHWFVYGIFNSMTCDVLCNN